MDIGKDSFPVSHSFLSNAYIRNLIINEIGILKLSNIVSDINNDCFVIYSIYKSKINNKAFDLSKKIYNHNDRNNAFNHNSNDSYSLVCQFFSNKRSLLNKEFNSNMLNSLYKEKAHYGSDHNNSYVNNFVNDWKTELTDFKNCIFTNNSFYSETKDKNDLIDNVNKAKLNSSNKDTSFHVYEEDTDKNEYWKTYHSVMKEFEDKKVTILLKLMII